MSKDRVQGKTIRFTFQDGPMAEKTFEHRFDENGTVAFHLVGGAAKPAGDGAKKDPGAAPSTKYEAAVVRDDVCAVSYLGAGGYTLTTVLDFTTKKLVAFSSNEKMLALQRGTFEEVAAR